MLRTRRRHGCDLLRRCAAATQSFSSGPHHGQTPLGDFHIRLMRRDELAFAIELAAREGWNPGLHDAECFFEADPGGFFIGELTGQPIGCISAVSYGEYYGFVGLYFVRPEFFVAEVLA